MFVGRVPLFEVPLAKADHEDGHLLWGGLLYGVIEGRAPPSDLSPPTLCSPDLPTSTAAAAAVWENAIGTTIFAYQSSCGSADVTVSFANFQALGCNQPSSHMCTQPTIPFVVNDALVLPIRIGVDSDLAHPSDGLMGQTTRPVTSHMSLDMPWVLTTTAVSPSHASRRRSVRTANRRC